MDKNYLEFNDEHTTLIEVVDDRLISNTQSLKTLVIERDQQRLVSFQKWWRKSRIEPWNEGKGFCMDKTDAKHTINALNRAIDYLKA